MTATVYEQKWDRAQSNLKTPGSRILTEWKASRERARGFRNDGSMSMSEFSEYVKGTLDYRTGTITERNAMSVSAVYACVNLIGGAVASLPLQFFRRDAKDNRKAYKPDLWWMFNEQPCVAWAAATAWEYALQSLLLRGDSFWRIIRASRLSANIVGFEPRHPSTVTPRRVTDRLVYDIDPQPWDPLGTKRVTVDQDDMLHIAGPNFDGLRGQSQIGGALRISGSLALSSDEYMLSFYKNSARPDFALQTDGVLDNGQIDNLRNQVNEQHQGVARSWKPIVLQGGLKVQPITINPRDAQLMEMRKFQVEDVCRVMGVPPFMVGYTEKTTSWGSGVEQMGIGFVKYTLQRHLVKFEQEINRKVFRTARNFCEFNTAGLERGDTMQRFNAYRVALGRAGEQPWMAVDEIRKLENWEPRDDLQPVGGTPAPEPAPGDDVPVEPKEPKQPDQGGTEE